MFLKALASIILSISFLIGGLPVTTFSGSSKKADFAPASFDTYEITLADGSHIKIMLVGANVIFESDVDREYYISLAKTDGNRTVRKFSESGESFSIEMATYMSDDELYTIYISYDVFGDTVTNGNNIIFKHGSQISFWKNSTYDYNLETCSELWTDAQSLKECLEPQNDIECDDPVLIGYSNQICEGAANEWEKAYKIYMYVIDNMAYDQVEVDDYTTGFQDGAVTVLRDGKSICEGLCNALVALCRAQGIPAVVEFGMGYVDYNGMVSRTVYPDELADHAWAAVYLGDRWHFVDPTFDMAHYYLGPGNYQSIDVSTYYYLLPLESFSNDHMIMDADTMHGIPSSGSCGDSATYEITRDGVCHISGSGVLQMPTGVIAFKELVFEPGCTITEIGDECFCDCDLLSVVILPDTVVEIHKAAFGTCEDLEYVYLPEGLKYLDKEAFIGCEELAYVYVPDSVKSMGDRVFDGAPRLYISLPSHLDYAVSDYDYYIMPMHVEIRN